MLTFKKVFASVFLAVLSASTTTAIPFPVSSKFATHRTREISQDFKIEVYHPQSTYEANRSCHTFKTRADNMFFSDFRGGY